MKVKIDCPKCNGEKVIYKDTFTKCIDCMKYEYSGLQPPSCSEDVIGCSKTLRVTCDKCYGEGKIIVDGYNL